MKTVKQFCKCQDIENWRLLVLVVVLNQTRGLKSDKMLYLFLYFAFSISVAQDK